MRTRWAALAALCLTTVLVSACGKTSEGEPVADDVESVAESTPSTTVTSTQTTRAIPTPEADLTEPGVLPTTRTAVAPGTVTCAVPDPSAERGDGSSCGSGGTENHCRSAARLVDDARRR